jgi:hypothetical protein
LQHYTVPKNPKPLDEQGALRGLADFKLMVQRVEAKPVEVHPDPLISSEKFAERSASKA